MTYLLNRHSAALACAVLALGACKDNTAVPDLNNPSVQSLGGALTKGNLQTLFTGVLNQDRSAVTSYAFFVFPGTVARDVLRLDNSESRFETETLELPPSPGGFLAGGFTPYYVAIRAENNLLSALPRATAELSKGDTSAVGGLVRTFKALDLYRVLETRDTYGIPVAVSDPTVVAPILCKPKVLVSLSAILDTAYTELQAAQTAGTTTFPVALPSGLTSVGGDYSTIANQIKFNRGLKGKIEVYRGLDAGGSAQDFTDAVAALNIALAGVGTDAAALQGGPYYQFSTASGETANPNFDTRIHFQPAVHDSLQPGDLRGSKIVTQPVPAKLVVDGVSFSTPYDPAVSVTSNSANQTRPIPILKNEELYLLRAQAEIELGNLVAAAADLNVVRTTSGGLPPVVFTSKADAIDKLLYEKHYSLLTDGPQRLVDLRAYDRLNATTFPPGTLQSPYKNDPFTSAFPYPQAEIDARKGNITCQ